MTTTHWVFNFSRLEEENIQKQKAKAKSGNNNNNTSKSNYQPELRLHELRSETYNALVRLLKPGCRTIVLVIDMQSRQQLIPPYHKAVWPYRRYVWNSTWNNKHYYYIQEQDPDVFLYVYRERAYLVQGTTAIVTAGWEGFEY